MIMDTKIGDCIFSPPYLNYGGFVHFPKAIVDKVGTEKIISIFREMHGGAYPLSTAPEDFGYRVEMPKNESMERINEFIGRVLEN